LVALSDSTLLPLLYPYRPQAVLLVNNQCTITQADFLRDLARVAEILPDAAYAFNVCEDRYYFLLAFCALLLKNSANLLPPGRQRATPAQIAADYPGSYCLSDSEIESDIPCNNILTLVNEADGAGYLALQKPTTPAIPVGQLPTIAFTSGSTSKPAANLKHWGTLARTARLLAAR